MQLDPMENWRQLTQHYAEMSDGELIALAEDFKDLTDTARQALRDEMHKRNLGDPQPLEAAPAGDAVEQWKSSNETEAESDRSAGDAFDWKEVLYRCSDPKAAWRVSEALRRAGIESWTDNPNQYAALIAADTQPSFRVLVLSERLEEARSILAHSMPLDITEESNDKEPEYQPPVCPQCGATDPTLERVEPNTNFWKCDDCGKEWTEAAQVPESAPGPLGDMSA